MRSYLVLRRPTATLSLRWQCQRPRRHHRTSELIWVSGDDKRLKQLAITNSVNRPFVETWKTFVLSCCSCNKSLPDRLCLPHWALSERELPVCRVSILFETLTDTWHGRELLDRTAIASALRRIWNKTGWQVVDITFMAMPEILFLVTSRISMSCVLHALSPPTTAR